MVTTKKVMKTYKDIWDQGKRFNYETNYVFHGLLNYYNNRIGYNYKDKYKGFWLSCYKL